MFEDVDLQDLAKQYSKVKPKSKQSSTRTVGIIPYLIKSKFICKPTLNNYADPSMASAATTVFDTRSNTHSANNKKPVYLRQRAATAMIVGELSPNLVM